MDDYDSWQWDELLPSSADKLIRLTRVFGPLPPEQTALPPQIGVGEITSEQRRDVGALELVTRLRAAATPGQPAGPGGLAWYRPDGSVRYAVVAPDQTRMLWQGDIGRIPNFARLNATQREAAVRRLLTQVTGQRFRNFRGAHRGPDLVPR